MGTSFDCFDVKANTAASGLSDEEDGNRVTLSASMRSQGFQNYPLERWHYTLVPEPYPDSIFDFPIEKRTPR
ncbi:MAG: M15 family metallopeptidase [Methyloceanibacter sp.]|uniref:M15 family metallopeptidase n=1 Tax=Methyloceanibacter sp. TaxID=1965321 RepID=UPI003D9BAEBA